MISLGHGFKFEGLVEPLLPLQSPVFYPIACKLCLSCVPAKDVRTSTKRAAVKHTLLLLLLLLLLLPLPPLLLLLLLLLLLQLLLLLLLLQ